MKQSPHQTALIVAAAFGGFSGHAATASRCHLMAAHAFRRGDIWSGNNFLRLADMQSSGSKASPASQRQRRKARRQRFAAGDRHAFKR